MNETQGYILIVAASILWGTMGILAKLAFAYGIQPETLIAIRLALSFTTLFSVLALFSRGSLKIQKTDILPFVAFGLFGVAFQRISYFYAVQLTTATMAAILFYTYPVLVTLTASAFLKERISPWQIITILMTFLGVALVVRVYDTSALGSNISGIASGLLSSILFVFYFMIVRRFRSKYASWTITLYGELIGALTLTPVISVYTSQILTFPYELWLIILTIAWVPSLLAYLLYSTAVKHVKASKGSTLGVMEPLSAALLSTAFLGENIESLQILGIIISLTGLVLLFQTGKAR